jgi:hypothetical protein
MLWVAAALNNLAWAQTHPDAHLATLTLRLTGALPPAATLADDLAYHSLLRHLPRRTPGEEWQPAVSRLLERSPLTAAWLPQVGPDINRDLLLKELAGCAIQRMLRDRWLDLLPHPETLAHGRIDSGIARANVEIGRMLDVLLEYGGQDWLPFVLSFYEADCNLQQRGRNARLAWPLLDHIRTARVSNDPLVRRNAERLLARYRPLARLMADETVTRPYLYLDGRFLEQIALLLPAPAACLKLWPVAERSGDQVAR